MIPLMMGCCAQGAIQSGEPTFFTVTSTGTQTLTVREATFDNYTVDWGDGTQYSGSSTQTKTYSVPGTYMGSLKGPVGGRMILAGNALVSIQAFQDGISSIAFYASGYQSPNLTTVPSTIPASITSCLSMFRGCTSFEGDYVSSWDVSNVTDMRYMFSEAPSFNANLSPWDVSSVFEFDSMFYLASSFSNPVSTWNVGEGRIFNNMFRGSAYNQPLDAWDVSKATHMNGMFSLCPFNQDISGWNVGAVTQMNEMFGDNTSFNQNIGSWDVSSVTTMLGMFYNASSFNRDLSGWCVSNIASEPSDFDTLASSWVLPRPVWGTCPGG